jgi:hypothetical protein
MKTAVLFLTTLAVGPTLAAQGRPSGTELYERYIEASGGKAAMQKATSRHVWGRFEVPAQGMGGPVEILTATPMKMLTKIEIPGMGSTTSGLNGETGWVLNPAMGPMLLDGIALDQMKQQADMTGVLDPSRYVKSRQTTGEAEHGGMPCWVVTVTTNWNESYSECYDKATGLLAATTRKQVTPMGELEATTVYADYKVFDGVKMSTTIRASTMGIEQVIHIDSMSTKAIPDSVFELPKEIKALKKP